MYVTGIHDDAPHSLIALQYVCLPRSVSSCPLTLRLLALPSSFFLLSSCLPRSACFCPYPALLSCLLLLLLLCLLLILLLLLPCLLLSCILPCSNIQCASRALFAMCRLPAVFVRLSLPLCHMNLVFTFSFSCDLSRSRFVLLVMCDTITPLLLR